MQAVIFDWGGVIMRTEDPEPRQRWARRLGLSAAQVYAAVFDASLWDELQLGWATQAEFLADLGERLALGQAELDAFWQDFWSGDRLDQAMIDYIRQLQSAGLKTALLSNAPPGLAGRIEERYAVADAFDVLVCSGDVGLKKPDAAIYRLTLERLNVEPQQAVFVDDFAHNIAAAADLGLHTLHFGPTVDWRSELDRLLGR